MGRRRALITPSCEQGHLVGEQHRGGPVGDDEAGRPGEHLAQRLGSPSPRCARPARTAGRRGPAPRAGPGWPAPARGAGAGRRTASCPARRSGCPGPRAGRGRSRPGRPPGPARSRRRWRPARRADVLPDARREQGRSSNALPTRERSAGERQVADVDAVEGDPARGRVGQPGDELEQGGLARAGGADQPERLPRLEVQADPAQDGASARRVAELDPVEDEPGQAGRCPPPRPGAGRAGPGRAGAGRPGRRAPRDR